MIVKIAMFGIISTIITYYTYNFYLNEDKNESYLTKTYIKENKTQCNNKIFMHKKTYIKRIVIRKKNENNNENLIKNV